MKIKNLVCFVALLPSITCAATWIPSITRNPEVVHSHQTAVEFGRLGNAYGLDEADVFTRENTGGLLESRVTSGLNDSWGKSFAGANGSIGAAARAEDGSTIGQEYTRYGRANVRRQITMVPMHPTLPAGTPFQTTLTLSFHASYSMFASNIDSHENTASVSWSFNATVFDATTSRVGNYGKHERAIVGGSLLQSITSANPLRSGVLNGEQFSLFDTSDPNSAATAAMANVLTVANSPADGFASGGDAIYNPGRDITVTVPVPLTLHIGQEFGFEYFISARATTYVAASEEGFPPAGFAFASVDALNTGAFSLSAPSAPGVSFQPTFGAVPEPSTALLAFLSASVMTCRRARR